MVKRRGSKKKDHLNSVPNDQTIDADELRQQNLDMLDDFLMGED